MSSDLSLLIESLLVCIVFVNSASSIWQVSVVETIGFLRYITLISYWTHFSFKFGVILLSSLLSSSLRFNLIVWIFRVVVFVPIWFGHLLIWLLSNWLSSVWSWRFQNTYWFYRHSLSVSSWSGRRWLLNIRNKSSSVNIWVLEFISVLIRILRFVYVSAWGRELINRFSCWRFTIAILFTIWVTISMSISSISWITTTIAARITNTWMSITISRILAIDNRIFQIMTNMMLILYSLIFNFSHNFFFESTHMSWNFLFNFLLNQFGNSFSHVIWDFLKLMIERGFLVSCLFKTFDVVFLMIHSKIYNNTIKS